MLLVMNDHDPLDLHEQEDKRQAADDKSRSAQRTERDDILWLMSGKRGRRLVRRMLERAGVWRLSFSTNALQMAFNEGMRNEGLAFTAKIMAHCPAQYAEMLMENQDD